MLCADLDSLCNTQHAGCFMKHYSIAKLIECRLRTMSSTAEVVTVRFRLGSCTIQVGDLYDLGWVSV